MVFSDRLDWVECVRLLADAKGKHTLFSMRLQFNLDFVFAKHLADQARSRSDDSDASDTTHTARMTVADSGACYMLT